MKELLSLLLLYAVVLIIPISVCGLCWQYTINTWLLYFGKVGSLYFWQGCLMSVVPVLGQLSIPGAIATWLLMMFLPL